MALKVGVIGCGDISDAYFTRAPLFRDFVIVACTDLRLEAAARQAAKYGVAALCVDYLLAAPDIDIVLNLTVPAAHAPVALRALEAGKHVYGEKPLATSVAEGEAVLAAARKRGLRVGSAPDTVLGGGYQLARALIDAGALGRPLLGHAAFLSHGMEHWHPNPEFFFKPGAGPVFDMGPYYIGALVTLLGPVAEVQAAARIGFAERIVTTESSALRGRSIRVETPTSVQALLSFENGAEITFQMSWDVWRHSLAPIELHGEKASFRLPDPNTFGGEVLVATGRGDWIAHDAAALTFGRPNHPPEAPRIANYRGLGLAEMARAIIDGRQHRANGEVALHALATMESVLRAAAERRPCRVAVGCERPAALGEAEAASLLKG